MDPLSALSVAASVVSFIDFSGKLVSRFFQIKKSVEGQPSHVVGVQQAATELLSVTSEADKKLGELVSSYPKFSDALTRLKKECATVEGRLSASLQKLTVRPSSMFMSRQSSVGVAIRSIWSDEEIQEWEAKLDRIRSQVMINVLMCLWDDARKTRDQMEDIDEGVGHILETVQRIETTMNALQDDFTNISMGKPGEMSGRKRFHDALWASTALIDIGTQHSLPQSSFIGESLGLEEKGNKTAKKVLENLSFSGMAERNERIKAAYPTTFKWLFNTEGEEWCPAALKFTEWLRSANDEIFWITGKPASGKSTLMKFIVTHPELQAHLGTWASGSPCLVASFYFWGPGSRIQKSQVGLLRSLLYQLLSQRPDMCQIVAPRRWAFFSITDIESSSPEWEWTELRQSLHRFCSAIKGQLRLALFIDGIDEYAGDHGDLIGFLHMLHKDYDAKLCVSSRPWNIFSDEFRRSPSLIMQDLTAFDIKMYIEGRLGSSLAVQELGRLDPKGLSSLRNEIENRASGVFLWVVLVVEQLLLDIRDKPFLADLWETFNALPPDLEDLYDAILTNIDPDKQQMASKIYLLLMAWKRCWNGQIDTTTLWLAVNCTSPTEPVPYPGGELNGRIIPVLKRLLEGHTRGILQISGPLPHTKIFTIDFLHRTAFDWIQKMSIWSKICSRQPPGFDAVLTLIAVLAGHLQSLDDWGNLQLESFLRIIKFSEALRDTSGSRKNLLGILKEIHFTAIFTVAAQTLTSRASIPELIVTENHLALVAAMWPCVPLLKALFEARSMILPNKDSLRSIKRVFGRPTSATPLEGAVLGPDRSTSEGSRWYHPIRTLGELQIAQRLDAIEYLLGQSVKPEIHLKRLVQQLQAAAKPDSNELRYWTLVSAMLRNPSDIRSLDNVRNDLLRGLEDCRLREEFPDLSFTGDGSRYI